jgi:acetylornithine deacetylase/succinyl-diaminopimelate desuccinylase-like protein
MVFGVVKHAVVGGLGEREDARLDACRHPRRPAAGCKISLCTEAGLFYQKGFPALAFGPGVARGNVHGPNEHNLMPQLQQAVSFYERMIEKVCL